MWYIDIIIISYLPIICWAVSSCKMLVQVSLPPLHPYITKIWTVIYLALIKLNAISQHSTLLINLMCLVFYRFWDLKTGDCLRILRKFSCNLEPNSQILSCDSVQSKNGWLITVCTYDGSLYILK